MIYNKYSNYNNALYSIDIDNILYDEYNVFFYPVDYDEKYNIKFKLNEILKENIIIYNNNLIKTDKNIIFNINTKLNNNILSFSIKTGIIGEYNINKNNIENIINILSYDVVFEINIINFNYLLTLNNYIINLNDNYFIYHRLNNNEDFLQIIFRNEKKDIKSCKLKLIYK